MTRVRSDEVALQWPVQRRIGNQYTTATVSATTIVAIMEPPLASGNNPNRPPFRRPYAPTHESCRHRQAKTPTATTCSCRNRGDIGQDGSGGAGFRHASAPHRL